MAKIASVYLGGPDLWFPDSHAHAARKRALCQAAGFAGLTPLEEDLFETEASEAMAREIYAANLMRLRKADALIANLTPWRGAHCDPGVAFECGFMAARAKPVLAYMNVADEDEAELKIRVLDHAGGDDDDGDGKWTDADGCEIEDFGLPENLMLWAEARRLYVIVTPEPLEDLTGLELCLEALRLYAD